MPDALVSAPAKTNPELFTSEGLLIIVNLLNALIDSSGKRKEMVNASKDKVIEAYDTARNFMPVKELNDQLRVTNQKIFRIKVAGKCTRSTSKHCMKLCPTQLCLSEQQLIKRYLEDSKYENLPINHIWADAYRNGLHISKDTFYKYVNQIRGKKLLPKDEAKEWKSPPIRSDKPFGILHMDSTTFRCQNGERVYVHFVMDNYSRTVLGAIPSYSSKSDVVATNLKNIIQKYKLQTIRFELYCDDGPENHGEVTKLLQSKKMNAIKIVANYKSYTSNNMIEAWNKKFKWIILKKFQVRSFADLEIELPKMVDYFNNLKLPVLRTLSPNEAIKGVKYEDLDMKNKIAKAKEQRLEQNRALACNTNDLVKQAHYNCSLN